MRIKGISRKEILLLLGGIFMGRMNHLGMNPFVLGYFVVICQENVPKGLYFIGILAGLQNGFGTVTTLKYALAMGIFLIIHNRLTKKWEKLPVPVFGGIAGTVLILVELFWKQSVLYQRDILLILLQGILVAVLSGILSAGIHSYLTDKDLFCIGNEELISIMVLGALVIYGVPFWENSQFALLPMLLSIMIILMGYRYGAGAGSLWGAISGLFLLHQENGIENLGLLCILGIGAGAFRELGKGISSVTYLVLYIFLGSYFDTTLLDTPRVRGVVAGILVFLLLPKKIATPVELLVKENDLVLQRTEEIEKHLKRQLELVSVPFFRLHRTFKNMMPEKTQIEETDIDRVLKEVEVNLCVSCEKSNRCLGYTRHKKYGTAGCILNAVREQGIVEMEDFPLHFVNKCDYLPRYLEETNYVIRMLRKNLEWKNRLLESREAIAEQFHDIGTILQGLSKEINKEKQISVETNQELISILKRNGILTKKLEKTERLNGYQEVRMIAKNRGGTCVTTRELANYVSKILGKSFVPAPGSKNVLGKEYEKILLVEDTKYKVLTGVARLNKEGEMLSGDSFSFLWLDGGEMVMTLADGMGSGQGACQESTEVVELLENFLEAGVSEKTAIRLINSILVLDHTEQKFSTLDLVMVNLYTGVCDFLKMGASSAFVKRDNWVEIVSSDTLPMGVFNSVDCVQVSKKLYPGEFVILLSDGVLDIAPIEEKESYFQEYIMELSGKNPNEIAEQILNHARKISGNEILDDMTVLVAGLWEK